MNVFARLNRLKKVIETDLDTRTMEEVPSKAVLPLSWESVMLSILRMPVPLRDEPAPVAGEVNSERRPNRRKENEMWNQGNGNGNGYGQGNGYGPQDTYDRLNNTREIGGARFPFLEGTGRYALCTLEEFQHSTDGPSVRALFEVLECKDGKHAPGSFVVKIWKVVRPPKFQNGLTDADHFADFCRKLKNAPAGYPIGNDIRVLLKDRAGEQLARGTVIDAVATPNKKGTWINVYWNAVQQAPQDIAAMRQRLEQKGIPDTGAKPQQAQPQYVAPQMQPQYVAPAQPQYVAPAQPQYTQPQGYAQPMPQQPQYAPAAPQGGFLAQIPPNGPQGGNNGNGGTW